MKGGNEASETSKVTLPLAPPITSDEAENLSGSRTKSAKEKSESSAIASLSRCILLPGTNVPGSPKINFVLSVTVFQLFSFSEV